MLNFSDKSYENAGRCQDLPSMTTQQARILAQNLLAKKLPGTLDKAVDYLTVGGVMTAAQLGISPRTLRYHKDTRVADRLSQHRTDEIAERFQEYGIPLPKNRESLSLYTLGPVGIEISKMRYESEPSSGHIAYPLNRIMHDVSVNELALQISASAQAHGWNAYWIGEQEAALYQGNRQVLKPDALLRFKKEWQEYLLLIEYHNEDHANRAREKVQNYEQAQTSGLWHRAWETDRFPPILAAFRKTIVGEGYKESVQKRYTVHCTYYGRLLKAALKNIDGNWVNINNGEKRPFFPWIEGGE